MRYLSSSELPAGLVRRMTRGLPEIRYWRDPEWRVEDLDYGNRIRLVLNVHHPATGGGVRVGEAEFHHQADWSPHARTLIERANQLAAEREHA
jgi:hypothetical protein